MPCQPDVRVRIDLGHIGVEVYGGPVIFVLIIHRLHDASQVGGKEGALAVTDLPPKVRASLATAATEEQVVIDLIIRCGASSVKKSRGCAFQGYHNRAVGFVGIDVSTKAVGLPSEAVGVVKPAVDGLPILRSGFLNVIICCHSCKGQYRLFVCDIWTCDCVHHPIRWR